MSTLQITRVNATIMALALLLGGGAIATAGWLLGANSASATAADSAPSADAVAGTDGIDGLDGAPGSDGADGTPGKDGAAGPAGPRGLPGLNGTPGAQGPAGPAGPQGPAGIDGADGLNGADGVDGSDGLNGTDGADGTDGAPGPPGPTGPPGAPGLDGQDGAPGMDGDAAAPWVLLEVTDVSEGAYQLWYGLAVHSGDSSFIEVDTELFAFLDPGTYRFTLLARAAADDAFEGNAQIISLTPTVPTFGTTFASGALDHSLISASGIWGAPDGAAFTLGGYINSVDLDATIGNIYLLIEKLD